MNDRRTIRLATTADAAAIAAIYAPFCSSSAITFEVEPLSAEAMAERMRALGERFPWLVMEVGGDVAGYAYAAPHHERAAYRWAVNVSVYIHERHRRRGVGRALYQALFTVLRLQGYVHAIAGITLPNDPSAKLHESLGFQRVGVYPAVGYKLGAWRDVGWWQLPLFDPLPNAPPEPLRMADVAGDARFQSVCGEPPLGTAAE
jgi:phosphinothricin acetyltransferase